MSGRLLQRRQRQIEALEAAGVTKFDVAVSFWRCKASGDRASKDGWERPASHWRYHNDRTAAQVMHPAFISWLSLANTSRESDDDQQRGAEIYIRPARAMSCPVIFLDDATPEVVEYVRAHWWCLVVKTSGQSHHLWIMTDRSLDQRERYLVQSRLVLQLNAEFGAKVADPGSVSGEHLGRFAAFKNRKPWREAEWVNLVHIPVPYASAMSVTADMLVDDDSGRDRDNGFDHVTNTGYSNRPLVVQAPGDIDRTQSGREYGYILRKLYFGDMTEDEAIAYLESRPETRAQQGANLRHYAARTARRAQAAIDRGEVPYGCRPKR